MEISAKEREALLENQETLSHVTIIQSECPAIIVCNKLICLACDACQIALQE